MPGAPHSRTACWTCWQRADTCRARASCRTCWPPTAAWAGPRRPRTCPAATSTSRAAVAAGGAAGRGRESPRAGVTATRARRRPLASPHLVEERMARDAGDQVRGVGAHPVQERQNHRAHVLKRDEGESLLQRPDNFIVRYVANVSCDGAGERRGCRVRQATWPFGCERLVHCTKLARCSVTRASVSLRAVPSCSKIVSSAANGRRCASSSA